MYAEHVERYYECHIQPVMNKIITRTKANTMNSMVSVHTLIDQNMGCLYGVKQCIFFNTQYNNVLSLFKCSIIHLYTVIYKYIIYEGLEYTIIPVCFDSYHNFTHSSYDRKCIGTNQQSHYWLKEQINCNSDTCNRRFLKN